MKNLIIKIGVIGLLVSVSNANLIDKCMNHTENGWGYTDRKECLKNIGQEKYDLYYKVRKACDIYVKRQSFNIGEDLYLENNKVCAENERNLKSFLNGNYSE